MLLFYSLDKVVVVIAVFAEAGLLPFTTTCCAFVDNSANRALFVVVLVVAYVVGLPPPVVGF